MAFRCVYAAKECTGCMACYDDDEVDVDMPFDEEPLPEEDFEDDEVEG